MQGDIDFFRKEYQRQKKLEEIVHSRKLERPNTKKWQVVLAFAFFPILIMAVVFASVIIEITKILEALLLCGSIFLVTEGYLRFCFIQAVKCYQHYASDETRRRCLCVPSCSEYAIISLKHLPLTVAFIKIRKRLYKTCNGEEYKLDFPCKRMNRYFEEKHLK